MPRIARSSIPATRRASKSGSAESLDEKLLHVERESLGYQEKIEALTQDKDVWHERERDLKGRLKMRSASCRALMKIQAEHARAAETEARVGKRTGRRASPRQARRWLRGAGPAGGRVVRKPNRPAATTLAQSRRAAGDAARCSRWCSIAFQREAGRCRLATSRS